MNQDVQNNTTTDPMSNAENDIKAMFGITEDPVQAESAPSDDNEPANDTTEDAQDNGTNDEGGSEPTPTDPVTKTEPEGTSEKDSTPEERFSKQNQTFARMRVENKQLTDLVLSLAKASGMDVKNTDEAVEALRHNLTTVEAKRRNLPEEVLRELEEKDKALAQLQQYQAQENALKGFQKVKDLHALSRDDMNTFADALVEKGVDIYAPGVDLVKEYRNLHFEDAIKRAREEGRQEEIMRSRKAKTSSTMPSTQTGTSENTGNTAEPIKSFKDLEKLLSGLK